MLTIEDFVVRVYCLIDDLLRATVGTRRLRWSGPPARLSPAEVLTIAVVGEALSLGTDAALHAYFKRHWRPWFPGLGSRTSFVRQAANLWAVTQWLQAHLARELGAPAADYHVIDGLPIPVCRHGRAGRCKRFREVAARSWCDAKKEWYWGLKLHLVVDLEGVVVACEVRGANVDERDVAQELLAPMSGRVLGDGGYQRRALREILAEAGVLLMAPHHPRHRAIWSPETIKRMKRARRVIEVVNGQLVDRFQIARVWARDAWHFTARVARKLLGHTVLSAIARGQGLDPLEFAPLLAA